MMSMMIMHCLLSPMVWGGHHAGGMASKYFCQGLLGLASLYTSEMDKKPEKTMSSWIDGAIESDE